MILLVLITGTTGELFAQANQTNAEKTFELPANNIKRRFLINLDKGNKMQIELTDMDELQYLNNLDSLVRVFISDLEPLKDSLSLSDELLSRRIDYVIDSSGKKKIRILKYSPAGSSFLVNKNDIALLKIEQDSIIITGSRAAKSTGILSGRRTELYFFRVAFFLNSLNDLSAYLDGRLNEKISSLEKNVNTNWVGGRAGQAHIKRDPSITASASGGYIGGGDFLTLRLSVNAQNYKNYFVPSVSYGFAVITNNNLIRREYGVEGEQHFLFARNDSTGKLETFRNSFLTISYGRIAIKNSDSKFSPTLYPYFSLSYLIRRRGDFYEKNTFKLGLGRFSLFGGTTKIEPSVYFNNFFKGVTPSFRITQSF